MIVTALEDYGKSRKKVYLDGQFAFVLYKGELSGCLIKEQMELSDELYERIVEEILWKRIRQRSLYLLKEMDRTEMQIRQKLRGDLYPEELIQRAVEWMYGFHYLDDERYAENYVRCHDGRKSKRQMLLELQKKGVEKEIAEAALADLEEQDESEQIKKLIGKKQVDIATASLKEKQKLYGYLMRKGFSSSDIGRVLNGMEDF